MIMTVNKPHSVRFAPAFADQEHRMSIPVLLGIDLGTSSVKVSAITSDGSEIAHGSSDYHQSRSVTTRSPASLEGWWNGIRQAVLSALSGQDIEVAAVGLSGQMHGVVLLNAEGTAVIPPVLWDDMRAAPYLPLLNQQAAPFRRSLRNRPTPGFAASILFWLARSQPQLLAATRCVLQPKDWVGFRLTGQIFAEPSDASATGLWDFDRSAWHDRFCQAISINPALLAPIRRSDQIRGVLLETAAQDLGLPPGIPVTLGLADTAAGLLGSSAQLTPGQNILSIGTGGQLSQILSELEDSFPAGIMGLAGPPDHNYLMAPTYSAGLGLDWVRRLWSLRWEDLYEAAFSVSPRSSLPLFAPFSPVATVLGHGGAKPDVHAANTVVANWLDLSLGHSRAHLIRAAVEGSIYALRHARDLLLSCPHAKVIDTCTLVGGGARDERVKQLVADILGVPVYCPDLLNASSRGAALIAAVAAGWFTSVQDAARAFARPLSVSIPDPSATDAHSERFERFENAMAAPSRRADENDRSPSPLPATRRCDST
ncbi:MAG TPA: FGGY family carbohydrate kinase [Streptosporangiaceae bacterium]|nr:FGGY family carbohydrate kinase [Streptosporangiaceae bacterium]